MSDKAPSLVPDFPTGNEGGRRALLAYGMMLNSIVCLLADKNVITKEEYGDYLHSQAAKHPELELLRTMAESFSPTGLKRPTPPAEAA